MPGDSCNDVGMRSAVLAFAAGVLFLQTRGELPLPLPWLAGGVLACLPFMLRVHPATRVLLLIGCLLLGIGWAAWRADFRLGDELGREWEGRDVEVIGTVAGLPQEFERGVRFEFTVEQLLTASAVVPGRLQLAWYAGRTVQPAVRPGERWRLTVRLKRPHGGANPGGFDYEAWLLERGIRATGYVRPAPATRLDEFIWHPGHVIERLRAAVRDNLQQALPEVEWPWIGVITALAVGDQKAVQGDLWTVFNRTGTTHLMNTFMPTCFV